MQSLVISLHKKWPFFHNRLKHFVKFVVKRQIFMVFTYIVCNCVMDKLYTVHIMYHTTTVLSLHQIILVTCHIVIKMFTFVLCDKMRLSCHISLFNGYKFWIDMQYAYRGERIYVTIHNVEMFFFCAMISKRLS